MIFVESLSFRGRELESMILLQTSNMDTEKNVYEMESNPKIQDIGDQIPVLDSLSEANSQSPFPEPENRRNLAALKLQKVYKSFRTRRQLADCAVLVEQRWWKLLDFAELKRSSISFFDIDKTETAASRWYRARTRAAKVGKGLSKDSKARKLALQHWLEAIDPRHRYGHNLHFYYAKWLHCDSNQPFFYWLDIGEGREVNLERCTRSKLQQQCIKYLGPTERTHYEVTFQDGKFIYKSSGKLLDTRACKDVKWIFVLSTTKILYVGRKNKGTFQHSSFLAGGATLSAGRLEVEDGVLKAVWPHSGHYLPTEENFQAFMSYLLEQNVDLTDVKTNSIEEDEVKENKKNLEGSVKKSGSENVDDQENSGSTSQDTDGTEQNNVPLISRLPSRLCSKITKLEIPKRSDVLDTLKKELLASRVHEDLSDSESEDGYETAEESFLREEDFMISKVNLFDHEDHEEELASPITKEEITRRIDSHKLMKSYQLAHQLSSKWTTGAGPRIGCMRDYPSELQFRVLEQAHLSPRPKSLRSSSKTMSRFNPSVLTPISLCKLDIEPK